jgi:UPF0755 protein
MRRILWIVPLLILLAAGWVGVSLRVPYRNFSPDGVYVDIPHGASRRTIARLLAEQGVVRDRWVFEGLARWRSGKTLQAGEYFFDHAATMPDVFDTIASGRVFVRELIIPEGYSMFDIADLVEHEQFTSREDFLAAARNPAPIHDLAPDAPTLEGFLFPATYQFPRHPTGAQMTAAMVERFRQEWSEISAQQAVPPGSGIERVVTLASLVERETPKPDERPVVAGVFTNRLRRGVPLQCDPTVVYALELAGQYSGKLDSGDLLFESPYNSYQRVGLPPGPIANPGDASLRAALAPAQTDYLYFVANTEGGHFFSSTLAEHNHNVNLYRQRLAVERKASASPGAQQPNAVKPGVVRSR